MVQIIDTLLLLTAGGGALYASLPGTKKSNVKNISFYPQEDKVGKKYQNTNNALNNLFNVITDKKDITPILDVIAKAEANRGYDSYYVNVVIKPSRALTKMRVGDVMQWQRTSANAGSISVAAGRYQIISSTLKEIVGRGIIHESEYFDKSAQDRAAKYLLEKRGLSRFLNNQMTISEFANNLAKEWAGLPIVAGQGEGKSFYDGKAGNKARISVASVLTALQQVKGRA